MDDADRAQELIEAEDERRIKRAHLAGYDALACGRCLNCDAEVGPMLRFCDATCRNDWQARLDAMRRNGPTTDD